MTEQLSPTAQAVLDAYLRAPCDNKLSVAAALRAAAVIVAEDEMDHYAPDILHAIAAELEQSN